MSPIGSAALAIAIALGSGSALAEANDPCREIRVRFANRVHDGRLVTCVISPVAAPPGGTIYDGAEPWSFVEDQAFDVAAGESLTILGPPDGSDFDLWVMDPAQVPQREVRHVRISAASPAWRIDLPPGRYVLSIGARSVAPGERVYRERAFSVRVRAPAAATRALSRGAAM